MFSLVLQSLILYERKVVGMGFNVQEILVNGSVVISSAIHDFSYIIDPTV
jgi:hypothetical protein